jgi:hypothetical protein
MGLAWTKDGAEEKQLTITRGNGPRAREEKSRRLIRRECIEQELLSATPQPAERAGEGMEWKHGHPQQTCEKQLNAFWPLRKRLGVVPSEAESSLLGAFLCKRKKPHNSGRQHALLCQAIESRYSHRHCVG